MNPQLSSYYGSRKPSDNRMAQMEFIKRTDGVKAINVSVGNVFLPMHPKMQQRMFNLENQESMFNKGVVQYTQTMGLKETQDAFLNILRSSNFKTDHLYIQVTDGGSMAMELVVLGLADVNDKPILLLDPIYTNYLMLAKRTSRTTFSIQRKLDEKGNFSFPTQQEIEKIIIETQATSLIVIPYDNPTGQLFDRDAMIMIAKLCVKYNLWLVSDEAYRELHYHGDTAISIRSIDDSHVPGIEGRRISIESASKVWNACGLRIGALITDNQEFHEKSVAEQTAALCANTIGQYIFGAIAHESTQDLNNRYEQQRKYYGSMISSVAQGFRSILPDIIVAAPDAAIYLVVDVRNIVKPGFDGKDFALFCAKEGSVEVESISHTLLISPLPGFYQIKDKEQNPGYTQFRIAFVESPEIMQKVPGLFAQLLDQYESKR